MKRELFSWWGKGLIVGVCSCCGLVGVLAATLTRPLEGRYNASEVGAFTSLIIDNRLTADQWNLLLEMLDVKVSEFYTKLDLSAADKMPVGAVVAFDPSITSCPPGWEDYGAVNNRFIRGGSVPGGTGGNQTITIRTKNLPPHQHTLFSSGSSTNGSVPGSNDGVAYSYKDNPSLTSTLSTSSYYTVAKGGDNTSSITIGKSGNPIGANNAAINIMPPYIVLKYCKKVFYGGTN